MSKRAQKVGYKCLAGKSLTQPERVWIAKLIDSTRKHHAVMTEFLELDQNDPKFKEVAVAAGEAFLVVDELLAEEAPATAKESTK